MGPDADMRGTIATGRAARTGLFVTASAVFTLVSVLFFWNRGLSGIPFASDLVQPYLVVEDFLADPASFHSWRHSPSPYVLPDIFIAGGLVLLPLSPKWMAIGYSTLLLAGYGLTGGWLISRATGSRVQSAILLFILCLLALVFAGNLLDVPPSNWLLPTLFSPFIHTGALLCTLIAVALLDELLQDPGSRWARIGLVSLVFVATFSDALFLVWFVFPALVVLWLHAKACNIRFPWPIRRTLFFSAVVAIAIERVLHGVGRGVPLQLNSVARSATALWDEIKVTFAEPDWIMATFLVIATGIVLAGMVSVIRCLRSRRLSFNDAFVVFLASSIVSGVLVLIITSYFKEQAHWRYLIIIPLYAVLAISMFLSRVLMIPKYGRHLVSIAAAAAFVFMAPGAYGTATAPESRSDLEACLVTRGHSTGFANYWIAKRLIFLSERRIHIAQIRPDGSRHNFNYNRAWFETRADDGSPIAPTFIIIRGLDTGSIRTKFGAPRETVQCAGTEIWIYEKLSVP
ncbi:MAG: hypothetical protein NXI27_25930 [Alphaproteobacteria bacterium]|nr:hypothetical protein [Alphaproteobacteria bacterium]